LKRIRYTELTGRFILSLCPFVLCLVASPRLNAQDNYEIQVYGSETVAPKTTMVELHSNFTIDGSKAVPGSPYTEEGLYPTNHAEHETVEITQGVTSWSEVGFYIFTSYQSSYGYQWVGDHIRPRVRAPESWHLPVGLSISNEIGYQRARFFPDSWTWEIRPIIDKQAGRYYLSFNPTFDRALHGPGVSDGFVFSPNIKVGYDVIDDMLSLTLAYNYLYMSNVGRVGDQITSPFDIRQSSFFAQGITFGVKAKF